MSDIRMDMMAALRVAFMDQTNGVDCGSIIEAGCEARRYCSPEDGAYAFLEAAVDAVFGVLKNYGDDLLNDLAIEQDPDIGDATTIQEPKPLGVLGHLRMIRQGTIAAYDAGKLSEDQLKIITPERIAQWRLELEKPA